MRRKIEKMPLVDYTSVVLAIMVLLSVLNWLFYAGKYHQGPNVTLLVRD